MSVEIVPIAPSHAVGFHACLDAVARENKYLAQTTAPPLENVREFVRESVAKGAAQLVAVDGETVVGWCDVFPEWAAAVAHRGHLGMGLLPSYRGLGIGERLLRACLAKAVENGITRVELEVRADNERAIKLYERVGFTLEARKRMAMRFDGAYFDALQMSLLFGPIADKRTSDIVAP